MNALLGQLGVLAVALAVAGASVAAGDRTALVAPPERVAEEFVKHVVAGRYEPARRRLSDEARLGIGSDDLRQLRASIESRLGRVREVNGQNATMNGNEAVADMELTSADGSRREMEIRLVRRRGVWFVAGVPNV